MPCSVTSERSSSELVGSGSVTVVPHLSTDYFKTGGGDHVSVFAFRATLFDPGVVTWLDAKAG